MASGSVYVNVVPHIKVLGKLTLVTAGGSFLGTLLALALWSVVHG